jgi:hypothetical protein
MVGVNIRKDMYRRAVLLGVDGDMAKVINEFYERYLDELERKRDE